MRLYRWVVIACVATIAAGCAIEDTDTETAAATVARSLLERNCDDLLRANDGRGCDIEIGRQVCIVTTAVDPARVLRAGDPIPSASTLRLCSGGTCTGVNPQRASSSFHCAGLAGCLPLAVGCSNGGEMHCEPHPSPFPGGGTDYSCTCTVLD